MLLTEEKTGRLYFMDYEPTDQLVANQMLVLGMEVIKEYGTEFTLSQTHPHLRSVTDIRYFALFDHCGPWWLN